MTFGLLMYSKTAKIKQR